MATSLLNGGLLALVVAVLSLMTNGTWGLLEVRLLALLGRLLPTWLVLTWLILLVNYLEFVKQALLTEESIGRRTDVSLLHMVLGPCNVLTVLMVVPHLTTWPVSCTVLLLGCMLLHDLF